MGWTSLTDRPSYLVSPRQEHDDNNRQSRHHTERRPTVRRQASTHPLGRAQSFRGSYHVIRVAVGLVGGYFALRRQALTDVFTQVEVGDYLRLTFRPRDLIIVPAAPVCGWAGHV